MQKKEQQYDYDWEDRWIDTYLIGRGIYRVETRAGQSAGNVRAEQGPRREHEEEILGDADF